MDVPVSVETEMCLLLKVFPEAAMRFLKSLIPLSVRRCLRVMVQLRRRRPNELKNALQYIAIFSLPNIFACVEDFATRSSRYTDVRIRGHRDLVRLRNRTSDFDVFRQVFLQQQYVIPDLKDPHFIIDAGANIGLTSLFLLLRYPNATIIAIEPDPENFEIAVHNLRSFANRCHLVHGGLWSEDTELAISRGTYADGRHWATQTVKPASADAEIVPVYHLASLIDKYNFKTIDLLKIDIEGAELQVFRDGDTSFLATTECCAIECHGADCVEAFQNAISKYNFGTIESGELLIAHKPVG